MDDWNARVSRVAEEIRQYLEACPCAADSLEGIATWWISRQRIHAELEVVSAALEQLVCAGVILANNDTSESVTIYHLSDRND